MWVCTCVYVCVHACVQAHTSLCVRERGGVGGSGEGAKMEMRRWRRKVMR